MVKFNEFITRVGDSSSYDFSVKPFLTFLPLTNT